MAQCQKSSVVSRIILGCNSLSTLPTRRAAFRLLETAVQCGISHFDTARAYGQGYSERILGEFLVGQGSEFIVTTKCGRPDGRTSWIPTSLALPINTLRQYCNRSRPTAGSTTQNRRSHLGEKITRPFLEQSIEASLRSLRRSRIDVFLLHEQLPLQLDEGARGLIARLIADGTIGAFGTGTARATLESSFEIDDLCTVLQYDYSIRDGDRLLRRFPALTHYHHSLFRQPRQASPPAILCDALAANPRGKVLFGTRNCDHLRANVQGATLAEMNVGSG